MRSIFNIQFGDFYNSSPNWFDWLSLFVSVGAIIFAYWLGERNYKRDKKSKEKAEEKAIESEIKLFQNSLSELNNGITEQIKNLEEYIKNKDFRLKVNTSVQVNFLNFVDIKGLYKKVGNKTEKVKQINSLLTSLYGLDDFKRSLMDETRYYNKRYSELESIFRDNYKEVFYTKVAEINNTRAINFINDEQGKRWQYNEEDKFMPEYMSIIDGFEDFVKTESGNADRNKIDEKLIKVMVVSHKYMPEDYHAIIVNHLANKSHSAFIDMEAIDEVHFRVIESYLRKLEKVNSEINLYLKSIPKTSPQHDY